MADKVEIPKDITPKKFFEEFLVEQFEARKGDLPDEAKEVDAGMRFILTGDDGGTWTLSFKGGELKASEGTVGDPIMTIKMSVSDWKGVLTGERGGMMGEQMNLAGGGGGGGPALSADMVSKVSGIDGTLQFKLTDDEKDDFVVTLKFGTGDPKDEPDCTISMAAADSEAMRTGELNPQAAFMSGKIQIDGDMGLAMQIGTTLMAQ